MAQRRNRKGGRAGTRGKAKPLHPEHQTRLDRIEAIAENMDAKFRLPGTNIRFGFDAIVGLVPGVGDGVSALASAAILYDAWKIGIPVHKITRMGGNLLFDATVGAVPVLGDLFDIGWKANKRNARIVREHLGVETDEG